MFKWLDRKAAIRQAAYYYKKGLENWKNQEIDLEYVQECIDFILGCSDGKRYQNAFCIDPSTIKSGSMVRFRNDVVQKLHSIKIIDEILQKE